MTAADEVEDEAAAARDDEDDGCCCCAWACACAYWLPLALLLLCDAPIVSVYIFLSVGETENPAGDGTYG